MTAIVSPTSHNRVVMGLMEKAHEEKIMNDELLNFFKEQLRLSDTEINTKKKKKKKEESSNQKQKRVPSEYNNIFKYYMTVVRMYYPNKLKVNNGLLMKAVHKVARFIKSESPVYEESVIIYTAGILVNRELGKEIFDVKKVDEQTIQFMKPIMSKPTSKNL
jgi:hypothetical protein